MSPSGQAWGPLAGLGVALLLVGAGSRAAAVVGRPGALPPVSLTALIGLVALVSVVLVAALAPRVREATRVLISAGGLAACGLGLALLDGRGRPATPSVSGATGAGSGLLGLPSPTTALVLAALTPVVLHLSTVVAGRRLRVPERLGVLAGSLAGLVLLLVVGAGVGGGVGGVGPAVAASVAGAVLLALPAQGRRRPAGPASGGPEPLREPVGEPVREPVGRHLRSRTDLLPALGLAGLVLLLVAAGGPVAVASPLAVVGVAAGAERLARWRAGGQLEVLARCLGGTVLVATTLGAVVGAATGPRGWAGSLALTTVLGVAVAARSPRPPAPAYTRATHLRVVRALPGATVAGLLTLVALALPSVAPTEPQVVEAGTTAPGPVSGVPASVGSDPPRAGPTIRLGAMQGTAVQVLVSSPGATDPLEVRTRIGSVEVSYPLVRLAPGTEQVVEVALPEQGRFEVSLYVVTSPRPLQTLVVRR